MFLIYHKYQMLTNVYELIYSIQGAEEVTRETFAELWQQYFSSDDPAAPGNFIFGKTSF